MELTTSLKEHFKATANKLKGSDRRKYMAEVSQQIGNQRETSREMGWNRVTIRKGLRELQSGFDCIDAYNARGRNRAEDSLPDLLNDIKSIVDSQSQTDPSFKSTRLYTRLSAKEVRNQLVKQKGYTDEELPTVRTISSRLNELGYHLKRVQKSRPKKR